MNWIDILACVPATIFLVVMAYRAGVRHGRNIEIMDNAAFLRGVCDQPDRGVGVVPYNHLAVLGTERLKPYSKPGALPRLPPLQAKDASRDQAVRDEVTLLQSQRLISTTAIDTSVVPPDKTEPKR